jgi:sarcosine oxidase subunit gamma
VTADIRAHPGSPFFRRQRDLDRIAELSGGSLLAVPQSILAQVDVRIDPGAAVELGIATDVPPDESLGRAHPGAIRLDRSDGRFHLPTTPNRVWDGRWIHALWLGPDEWLVLDFTSRPADLAAALRTSLEGLHHSVVDVSANRVALVLWGRGRHELLAAGCALDLGRKAWRPGMCSQTLLARVPVILVERYRFTGLLVRPSFADYLVDWFVEHAVP